MGHAIWIRTFLLLGGSAKTVFKRSKIFDLVLGVSGLKDTILMLIRRVFFFSSLRREWWEIQIDAKKKSLDTQDIISQSTLIVIRTRPSSNVTVPPISELINNHKGKMRDREIGTCHASLRKLGRGETSDHMRIHIYIPRTKMWNKPIRRRTLPMLPFSSSVNPLLWLGIWRKGPKVFFFWSRFASTQGTPPSLRPSPPLSFLSVRTNKVQESSFQKINK